MLSEIARDLGESPPTEKRRFAISPRSSQLTQHTKKITLLHNYSVSYQEVVVFKRLTRRSLRRVTNFNAEGHKSTTRLKVKNISKQSNCCNRLAESKYLNLLRVVTPASTSLCYINL